MIDSQKPVKEKIPRTRNWTFVVYPDSAPDNWREILNESHVEWIESPLHDKDIDGSQKPKKPHWHIMILFSGVKTFEQTNALISPLNCSIPQIVHNSRACTRYMAHMDDPNKFQYPIEDIKGHGGVDLTELLKPSISEIGTILKEIEDFIVDKNITEFMNLVYYANRYRPSWIDVIRNRNTFYLSILIKSNRHLSKIVDYETGEIVTNNSAKE